MPYESTITFTLDTICPWTYLAYQRLTRALTSFSSPAVTFTLRFAPYQLYPSFSTTGEDKHAWYLREKFDSDEDRMRKFEAYMGALGRAEGVEMDFGGGVIAGSLDALRCLGVVQERRGEEGARRCLSSLYEQYFSQKQHPSAPATLITACKAAGMSGEEAEAVVGDQSEGLVEVKSAVREQVGNGVDSVPYVVVEGRRRDFTLVGAKEVGEYVKALEQVAKEV